MVKSAFAASSCYGIDMSSVCGWPQVTADSAYLIKDYIVGMLGNDGGVKLDTGGAAADEGGRKSLAEVAKSLTLLLPAGGDRGALSDAAVREWLAGLTRGLAEPGGGGMGGEGGESEGAGDSTRLVALRALLGILPTGETEGV